MNAKNKDGYTALMFASYQIHREMIKLLIDAGADVNSKANNGQTALMLASQKGHTEVVELLIEAGAKE